MRLIIVSNRLPLTVTEEDIGYRLQPSVGGLLSSLRSYMEHLQQPWTVALTSDRDLRRWQRSGQVDDGAAPATINRALSTLRRFCAWAVEHGHLADNPTAGLADVATESVGPQASTAVAVDALLRAARQQADPRRSRDEALLALLIYTGVRAR